MVQLQDEKKALKAAGINLVGISYNTVEELKKYSDKQGISFPLLSDEGSKTIDAFGIRNAEMDGQMFGRYSLEGIPFPGTYILDKEGVVIAKLFLERYQERHTVEQLIDGVKAVM